MDGEGAVDGSDTATVEMTMMVVATPSLAVEVDVWVVRDVEVGFGVGERPAAEEGVRVEVLAVDVLVVLVGPVVATLALIEEVEDETSDVVAVTEGLAACPPAVVSTVATALPLGKENDSAVATAQQLYPGPRFKSQQYPPSGHSSTA